MEFLGYVAMLFVGGSLGLIGGGGAILTVPIMVYLFQTPTLAATSYSLFIVGVSSLFGVWRYHQRKLVKYSAAFKFALPSFLGTYLARRMLLPSIPDVVFQRDGMAFSKDQLIMSVFAFVMLGASASMIRSGKTVHEAESQSGQGVLALSTLGLLVGFVAGFVGAGGGFLIIPALVVIARIPMATAVGTSLLIISANSLVGFLGDVLAGNRMMWSFLLGATSIALLGILGGAYAARFIPSAKLKPTFGWFVLIMGAYIMINQFRRF